MRSARWSAVWLLSFFMALGVAGCVGGETGAPDSGPDAKDGNDNGDGLKLCNTSEDCQDGFTCQGGVCTPANQCQCNYDCDKTKPEVCNKATKMCESGAPPLNCIDDCDCYAGEMCNSSTARCVPTGGDQDPVCQNDEDCEEGEVCQNGNCVPDACETREDCAHLGCKICAGGECVAPSGTCQSDQHCCVGFRCNFGQCVPEVTGDCMSDADCTDQEFPRCLNNECVPECYTDIDCPVQGMVCINNHCQDVGCTPQTCDVGYWCNTETGNCVPGCDSNSDCTPPDTCNYTTHQCGQFDCCGGCPSGQYCDTLTCQCMDLCQTDADCPTDFVCRPDGRCGCTPAACPAGTTCNTSTGECDAVECVTDGDCPTGWVCNPTTNACEPGGNEGEGAPCLSDDQCDATVNLMCDNCLICDAFEPGFVPTFTCRFQCSLIAPQCPPDRECISRRIPFTGLCMPTTP